MSSRQRRTRIVLLEVAPDEGAGLFAADALALRQAEVREAVEHAEVEHLGAVALLARHIFHRHAEDLRCRGAVDVFVLPRTPAAGSGPATCAPGCAARSASSRPRADTGRTEVARYEGAAHLAAELAAHGDVLQVGVVGRETPGRRYGLVERGVDAQVLGVDRARQRLDVGRAQLGHLAPAQDRVDDRVHAAQAFDRLRVGRVALLRLARLGQADLLEQHAES